MQPADSLGGYAMRPVISFIGRHNSGKTTVLTGVIEYLSQAGYKVAVIKHAHHNLDISDKDSELLFQSGADYVCASSPRQVLKYQRQTTEASVHTLLSEVPAGFDLVIVEGYKSEALLKIEVIRKDIDPDPMLLPQTIALVSDFPLTAEIDVFSHQAVVDIAKFLLTSLNI